jgi:hypothetical protein
MHELEFRDQVIDRMAVLIDSVVQTGYYFETEFRLSGRKAEWT